MLFNLFNKKKKRVAVLMGGPSSEHEVSLWSGKMIVKHLDKSKYDVRPVIVSKKNIWPIKLKELAGSCDVAFIAMHGEYGEDGQLQSQLEKHKLPYTGSNSKASRLAMDKVRSSKLFIKNGLSCPDFVAVKRNSLKVDLKKLMRLGLPLIVKPADRGSSVGVTIVKQIGQLAPALNEAFCHSSQAMVQKFVKGRELTCGVLEKNGKLVPLPPTEIIPKRKFFDYKAKYTPGASKEMTPPNLPEKTIKEIQKIALTVHTLLGCSSYSRTDMILGGDDRLHVLEINTLPGLTRTSLVPQAAKKAGFSFPQLLDIIIKNV